jgi:hypothetical protein
VACHVAAATPFVVACAKEMAHGWAPQGDDGAIVFRSWAVLSSHSPLVGQLTHATSSHAVFDPGPMLFWSLTIPVHLDHRQGGLWGAALLCVVGVSLAVEAAWSTMGWPAAVGVAAVILTMVAEFPAVALDPTWNAHIGLVWFVSTAAIAWAVAVGHLQWWPVVVVAASFATQCHLMFAIGSLSCVVVAPIVGFALSRRISWWLPAGILAGVACWIVPVVQQFTSHRATCPCCCTLSKTRGPRPESRSASRSLPRPSARTQSGGGEGRWTNPGNHGALKVVQQDSEESCAAAGRALGRRSGNDQDRHRRSLDDSLPVNTFLGCSTSL